ncbi:ATP-dependent DNA ligase, partial [Streptomyces violaceoruber]
MSAEARTELPHVTALPGAGLRAETGRTPGDPPRRPERGVPAVQERGTAHRGVPGCRGAGQSVPPLVLDGELVVARDGRLDFGELQARARRRGASAREVAGARPAHLIVFDVLETADSPLLDQPHSERRT